LSSKGGSEDAQPLVVTPADHQQQLTQDPLASADNLTGAINVLNETGRNMKSEATEVVAPNVSTKAFGEDVTDKEQVVTESLPSEGEHSIMDNFNGFGELLRGKPQALSFFFMMLLPAGICTIMYCIFTIISMLEDGTAHAPDDSGQANSGREQRLILGEVVQPKSAQRAYEPLCPELMAPSDSECFIALPSLYDVYPGAGFERLVVSKTGSPIVRVNLTRMADGVPDVAGGGSYGVPGQILERISLVAFKRQNALGFCELQIPHGDSCTARQMKCHIYRPTGELFATLEEEAVGVVRSLLAGTSTLGQKCYMLTTKSTGDRFWIQGDIAQRNLLVVSEKDQQHPIIHVESGKQLQFNTDDGNYYRLRVKPRVDAGVVIMALLAIDRLPGSHGV
jgi:hypothetical protein